MAERRMFSKTIMGRDEFLDMRPASQALYVHLNLNADDDGFVNSPTRIMRNMGAKPKDMEELVNNGYIIKFDSGVVAIKHWRVHNHVRRDRYKPSLFAEEKKSLRLLNGEYALAEVDSESEKVDGLEKRSTGKGADVAAVDGRSTKRVPKGNQTDNQTDNQTGNQTDNQAGDARSTQYRIGQDRLGKVSLGEDRLGQVRESADQAAGGAAGAEGLARSCDIKQTASERGGLIPTVEEVREYCESRNNDIDPQYFVDYYSARGWIIGNAPLRDWRACVRTWENKGFNSSRWTAKRSSFNSDEFYEAALANSEAFYQDKR